MLAAEQRTYLRHRPEHTLLYQLVEKNYPTFAEMMQSQGKALPCYETFLAKPKEKKSERNERY